MNNTINYKKKTGSCNKYTHPSNNLKLRSILSLCTIGIFIFFGFASISEETPVECNYYPQPIIKTHDITIGIYDKETKKPIGNKTIKFAITELKKIDDIVGCTLETEKEYNKTAVLDASGKTNFTLSKTYVSEDDEINIFFSIIIPNYNWLNESIKLKVNHLKFQKDYFLLEDEQYP